MQEFYDVLTKDRLPTGRTHPRGTPLGPGEYRPGAQIWIFRSDGRLMITRRHLQKDDLPGMWECTGGLVRAGETTFETILRETSEEIGLDLAREQVRLVTTQLMNRQFLDIYTAVADVDISELSLQPDEVIDARWVDWNELRAMRDSGEFVDFLYDRIMKYRPLL